MPKCCRRFAGTLALCGIFFAFSPPTIVGFERFSQHDYELEFEHAETQGCNKSSMEYITVRNVRPNRTYKAVNIGFGLKTDLTGNDFKARVQGWQFFHNEYRPTPILFDVKVCELFDKNLFGMQNMLTLGNLTKCPLRKGAYAINNYRLSASELPPHLPPGRWKFEVSAFSGDSFLAGVRFYSAIVERIKYKS